MHVLELLAIALAPGVAIMLYIYLKDKHEREPLVLLFISFVYGALSTFITLLFSEPLNYLIVLKNDNVVHQFIEAFFKVALVEELSKFVFVRGILYPNKNFNEPFDGIVYAVMVGMGFATLENVVYAFNYGMQTAWSGTCNICSNDGLLPWQGKVYTLAWFAVRRPRPFCTYSFSWRLRLLPDDR